MEVPTRSNIVVGPSDLKSEIERQEEKVVEENIDESVEAADEIEQELGDEVPSRYKKMTKKQLWEAYENIEKEKSRLGNEVGQLRKTVDEYILKPPKEERKPFTAEDILDNTDEVLQRAIQESDYVKQLEEKVNKLSSGSIEQQFYHKHPDAEKVLNSNDFADYVNSRPAARALAAEAQQSGDYNKLSVLLEDFKVTTGSDVQRKSQEKRDKQLRDAQLESKSSSGAPRKSGLTREKIMEVRMKEPERYWSPKFQEEVMRFYGKK